MKLGILYSVCGSVAILAVITMVILLIADTYGEQPSIASSVVRIIIGSTIGVGALSSGVSKIKIAKMKEADNAK